MTHHEAARPEVASQSNASQANPRINVTPLIDVLLVVLIIFLVLTPLKAGAVHDCGSFEA